MPGADGPFSATDVRMRPAEASDVPRVAAFLREVFQTGPEATFASERMLTWKYFDRRKHWDQDLSYVLERRGSLVAHAGLCPAVFRGREGDRVRCGTIIDWAADPKVPGAGLILYRRLMAESKVTFLIGGTDATRALAPRLGFRTGMEARVYSRWVRPLKEYLLRPKDGRAIARLLHGARHCLLDRARSQDDWRALPVSRFEDDVRTVLEPTNGPGPAAERRADDLNHRLECPGSAVRGYRLVRSGEVAGVVVVALGRWEAKILDLRVGSLNSEDWNSAVSAITEALAIEPSVCRIRALSSVPTLHGALEANGYWINGIEPVRFHDPADLLGSHPSLSIQFFESDLGFEAG